MGHLKEMLLDPAGSIMLWLKMSLVLSGVDLSHPKRHLLMLNPCQIATPTPVVSRLDLCEFNAMVELLDT